MPAAASGGNHLAKPKVIMHLGLYLKALLQSHYEVAYKQGRWVQGTLLG